MFAQRSRAALLLIGSRLRAFDFDFLLWALPCGPCQGGNGAWRQPCGFLAFWAAATYFISISVTQGDIP